MPITVSCAQCGKQLQAPDNLAGKRAKCSQCGSIVTIPASNATDTAYELEIIEDNAAPRAGEMPDDDLALTPPPRRPTSNVQTGSLLGDDLIEPELPITALVEHQGSGRGKSRGGRSKTTIDPASMPSGGGTAMNTWDQAAAANTRRRGGDGPQPWFSLLGVDFTPVKSIVLLVFLLLGIGSVVWWFTGPGKGLQIVEAYPVTQLAAMNSLARIENKGILNAMRGRQPAPTANANAGPLGGKYPDEFYNVGGPDRLIFTRKDDSGDYLFVHLRISERVAREEKMEDMYDLSFAANQFLLQVGTQEIKPIMMYEPLSGTSIQFAIGQSGAHTYHAIVPAGATPDEIQSEQKNGNSTAAGTLIFSSNPNMRGTLDFSSAYLTSEFPGVSGVSGYGEIEQRDPLTGTAIKYAYQGEDMTITWNTPGKAWWSSDQFKRKAAVNPFAKFDIYLIYPRPATTDAMVIKAGSRVVATLSASLAAKPGQQPTTVTVANTPGATAASPSGSTSTTGTQDMVDQMNREAAANPTPANTPKGDPGVFDYFGALARARNMGQGVVSSNNMKQLGVAVLMYAEQNNGDLPPTMDHLRTVLGDINAVLANVRTGDNPGYMYIPPGKNIRDIPNPAGTPILYETKEGKLDRFGSVMYLDGRIEGPKR